jgi:uroporphyrin-III C-methyltransferase
MSIENNINQYTNSNFKPISFIEKKEMGEVSVLPVGAGRAEFLTVIGAGPGDPDLITIKAIKALQAANVVLYDALINKSLLNYAYKAEKIFVGKRKGCYAYQQEQINELIVSRAKSHGHVVRLKGGDPFIFGRGAEEIDYAQQFDIKTDMIPGISSSLAVPAYQGIPLTKRGLSESFWVITGTTKSHKLSQDIYLAAKSNATVVILMGMSKLNEIVSIFAAENKQEVPVAIIQNGTTEKERFGYGTISTIEDVVSEKKISSPAIIVIGEVVNQRVQLASIYNEIQEEIVS